MPPLHRHFPALAGLCALVFVLVAPATRAETIPPAPPRHFNDYAHVVSSSTAGALDRQLEDFERASSNQLLVVVYPRMDSASSVADYTQRVAQSWRAGRKGRDNGAILFVFSAEHQLYIQVGYGLEGALPDALCRRIIADEIVPRFRAGDFDAGLRAGVSAMIAATKGEYQGTGRLAGENRRHGGSGNPFVFVVAVIFIIIASLTRRRRRVYLGGRRYRGGGWWIGGGGWGGGGGGGWSGGGGGGFSGGGGSFGGGGAGGSW